MKTSPTSLASFDRLARSHGLGTLAVGGLLFVIWLGGHGALYGAYRVTSSHTPAVVAEAN